MASTNVGSIHYDLNLDTSKFDKATQSMSGKLKDVGSKMTDLGKSMTVAITLPVVAGFGYAIKAASDYNETLNKIDVAFKDQSKAVKDWAKTSIDKMGLAKASALDAAALFGDMSTAMGLNTTEAANMSTELVQLGADLASFKNISFERAQVALAGVFTGETEALKGLGIVMTEASLEAFALKEGIKKPISEMSQSEKVQLRFAYLMDVTKNAQGDFERTQDGFANKLRKTREKFKELAAEIGEKLLPYADRLLDFIEKLAEKFESLTPQQQDMIIKVAAITAVVGPLLIVFGAMATALGTIISLLASPVFWVVAAILGVIAGVAYLVYQNWDKIYAAVKPAYDLFVTGVLPILKEVGSFIKDQFLTTMTSLKETWDELYETTKPYHDELKMFAQFVGAVLIGIIVVVGAAILGLIVVGLKLLEWGAKAIAWLISFGVWADQTMSKFKTAVSGAITGVINWFKELPLKIGLAVGKLGSKLFNAGKEILQGLWNGLKDKWKSVKEWVGGLGDKIKNLKGPIEKDKIMLVHEGKAIMSGLNKGLQTGYGAVEKTVAGITSNLASTSINVQGQQNQAATKEVSSPVNISLNMSGIMTRSRSDLRDIARDMTSALNEELQAKGMNGVMV